MTPKDYLTVCVSSLALIVAVYGVWERRYAARQAGRLRVSAICDDLAKLAVDETDLVAKGDDAANGMDFWTSRNERRSVLLSTAHELMSAFSLKVSSGELVVLSRSARIVGDEGLSIDLARQAVASADNDSFDQVASLRAIGGALARAGRYEEAKPFYEQALSVDLGTSDRATQHRIDTMIYFASGFALVAGHDADVPTTERIVTETLSLNNPALRQEAIDRVTRLLGGTANNEAGNPNPGSK